MGTSAVCDGLHAHDVAPLHLAQDPIRADSGALEEIVTDVLEANPAMVEDFVNSDEGKRKKKLGGFMGQIMKASKGQANPQQVNQILLKKLNELL